MAPTARGSIRQRRPDVWEIRVAAGSHPVTGRTVTRSVTFRGTERDAAAYATELASEQTARRSIARAAPFVTVDELFERWLAADHPWKPSTYRVYRSNAAFLCADLIGGVRVCTLTPNRVRAAMAQWEIDGASASVVGGRFRVLRAAIGWAYDERVIDVHPIRNMRGPRRAEPRRPLPDEDLGQLLHFAEAQLLEAIANDDGGFASTRLRHGAEQDLLLLRLAADTGARRGELAGLQFDDLSGRVLHIRRAVSDTVITTPKSGSARTLTVGSSTARLWCMLENEWRDRVGRAVALGLWLFASDVAHHRRFSPGGLGHRFIRLRNDAGVPGASLHQLRHSVATFLVRRGEILQAQGRLGHADASTTLREYSHALPLMDEDVADAIDDHLDRLDAPSTEPNESSA